MSQEITMTPLVKALASKRLLGNSALIYEDAEDVVIDLSDFANAVERGKILCSLKDPTIEASRIAKDFGIATTTVKSIAKLQPALDLSTCSSTLFYSHLNCNFASEIQGKARQGFLNAINKTFLCERLREVLIKKDGAVDRVQVTKEHALLAAVSSYAHSLLFCYMASLVKEEYAVQRSLESLFESFPSMIPLGVRSEEKECLVFLSA